MVRQVQLPSKIKGQMYLHHMPGRYQETLDKFIETCKQLGIQRVICLAPISEIQRKSEEYAKAIDENSLPWTTDFFPIEDFGTPVNPYEFLVFCLIQAANLVKGEAILIHCGAGVGRTSVCAVVILMILGFKAQEGLDILEKLGSHPDMPEQEDLIRWCARFLNR